MIAVPQFPLIDTLIPFLLLLFMLQTTSTMAQMKTCRQ